MIIAQLKALYALVSGVTELSETTGMNVGGQVPDPTVVDAPLPAAWTVFSGIAPVEQPKNGVVAKGTAVRDQFVVMVYLDYTKGQDNLIEVQLPILEKVAHAVAGQELPEMPGGYRFSFDGLKLVSINPRRLAYEMRFCIVDHI